jgi:hypothetical protein
LPDSVGFEQDSLAHVEPAPRCLDAVLQLSVGAGKTVEDGARPPQALLRGGEGLIHRGSCTAERLL